MRPSAFALVLMGAIAFASDPLESGPYHVAQQQQPRTSGGGCSTVQVAGFLDRVEEPLRDEVVTLTWTYPTGGPLASDAWMSPWYDVGLFNRARLKAQLMATQEACGLTRVRCELEWRISNESPTRLPESEGQFVETQQASIGEWRLANAVPVAGSEARVVCFPNPTSICNQSGSGTISDVIVQFYRD